MQEFVFLPVRHRDACILNVFLPAVSYQYHFVAACFLIMAAKRSSSLEAKTIGARQRRVGRSGNTDLEYILAIRRCIEREKKHKHEKWWPLQRGWCDTVSHQIRFRICGEYYQVCQDCFKCILGSSPAPNDGALTRAEDLLAEAIRKNCPGLVEKEAVRTLVARLISRACKRSCRN